MKNNKKPRSSYLPDGQKIPRVDSGKSPESTVNLKPAWRLAKLDMNGKWGFDKCDEVAFVHEKLKNFESMMWGEIERKKGKRGAKQNKNVPICNICKDARDRLAELKLEHDTVYTLHLSGLKRLWGIKDNEILSFLWWDPNHTVCPVDQIHT
ncbi:MAG: hypothetical protein ACLP9S_13825 [Syntrophales bacterium]